MSDLLGCFLRTKLLHSCNMIYLELTQLNTRIKNDETCGRPLTFNRSFCPFFEFRNCMAGGAEALVEDDGVTALEFSDEFGFVLRNRRSGFDLEDREDKDSRNSVLISIQLN
jgi:hypothetical protein